MFRIISVIFSITVPFLLIFSTNYNVSYAKTLLPFAIKKEDIKLNIQPSWLVIKDSYFYDAETDDLVTAGLGFSQLSHSIFADKFNDPNNPTIHELRKARLNRYIDTKTGEGYFFGFDIKKLTPLFDGRIAGTEVLAYLDKGEEKVAFLLQIPLDFDKKQPCIIAIPTMNSEGIYNAKDMQIRGLWGLNHNCAVVYNDKGLGNALFDIDNKNGYLINGQVANQSSAMDNLLFSPTVDPLFMQRYSNRYAVKQLHAKQNPEEKWGEYVINSIEFAFYQLNEVFSQTNEIIFDKDNTHVLVYGATDGGGAALKAGEYDLDGIIDGIVAINPQIQISKNINIPLFIQQGGAAKIKLEPKSLVDYSSYGALYIPCAIAALKNNKSGDYIPYADKFFFAEYRCAALKNSGLLESDTIESQANEALDKLYQYGWNKEMIIQLPYHYFNQSINLPYRYISQYGRYAVEENLCDYSVASINQEVLFNEGTLSPLTKTNFSLLWAKNSGSLPINREKEMVVIDLVNNSDPNGARREFYSRSKDSEFIDYNLSGALCLRQKALDQRVQLGSNKVGSTGKLNQIKTIIVHGQQNVQNLPNHSSRAYVALNSYTEGSFSQLRYIEVENASYMDSVAPLDHVLIPIDYYGESAMNMLWNNITKKTSLPDSQVIRTKVRRDKTGFTLAISKDHLQAILQTPRQENRIKTDNGTLILPK